MPALAMTGSPAARYSANFVGDCARRAGDGRTSRRATSAARRCRGTSSGGTDMTSPETPSRWSAAIIGSGALCVRISANARAAAMSCAISSTR